MSAIWPTCTDGEQVFQYYNGDYHLVDEARRLRQVDYENGLISKLTSKLSRATSPGRRHRYVQRIHKAQARLLALKLAQQ